MQTEERPQEQDQQQRQTGHHAGTKKEPRHANFRKHAVTNARKPGEPKWVLRSILLFLASIIILPLFRVRIRGAENIPQEPCLISPNHVSYYDGVLLFALTRRFKIPLRIFAKHELWKIKPLGWTLDSVGVLPISREVADREALSQASRALKAGDSLAIFPEGTRVRNNNQKVEPDQALGAASGGAAWLAIRNNVPVVPMAIAGTEKIRPEGMRLMRFPRVTIRFGTPLAPDLVVPKADYTKKERIARLTELIMEGLADTLEQAQAENATRKGRQTHAATQQTESAG